MFVAAAVNLTQKIHKEIIHESFGASSGLADGLWGNSSDRQSGPNVSFRAMFQFEIFR